MSRAVEILLSAVVLRGRTCGADGGDGSLGPGREHPDHGHPKLVEDGHSGLLVAPGRVDVLVDALAHLVADPGLREKLGARGREKVLAEFDVNASARQLTALLAENARRLSAGSGGVSVARSSGSPPTTVRVLCYVNQVGYLSSRWALWEAPWATCCQHSVCPGLL